MILKNVQLNDRAATALLELTMSEEMTKTDVINNALIRMAAEQEHRHAGGTVIWEKNRQQHLINWIDGEAKDAETHDDPR
jgi:hypothetical protein